MKNVEIFEDIADIEEKLNTDISSGLSRKAARERGEGEQTSFFVRKRRHFLSCYFGVIKMLPAAILTLVAIAALFMGRVQLAVAVLSTFISGSFISGMLYLAAQRQSERMECYSNPSVKVLRDGREYTTDCRNLTVGDVIILRAGDYIPADVCVVDSDGLVISAIYFDSQVRYRSERIRDGFDGERRLLAGSFVIDGYAKAVVTATGEDAVMSEHVNAGGLARRNSDPLIIKRTYKFLTGFVSILSVVGLVFAIVGMFTAKQVGVLEVFLTYLSLILSMTLMASPIVGRILLSAVIKHASKSGMGGDAAIIKNNRAIDVLPEATDIAVLGLSGIVDGAKYPSSVFLAGKHHENIYTVDPNSFIFRCIYSYVKATKDIGLAVDVEKRCLDGLMAGLDRIKFDREAEDVRIRSLFFGATIGDMRVACVETADGSFRTCIGEGIVFDRNCKYIRDEDGIRQMRDGDIELATAYLDGANARGEIVYTVISEIDGALIFEGLVGLRDGVSESFASISEVLGKKGIRTSILLDDNYEYNRVYIDLLGIDGSRIFRADRDEIEIVDGTGVYMGYSPEQYAELIKKMKASGRRVVSVGIEDAYGIAYAASDLVVSYDNINYGSPKYRESELEISISDGYEFSQRCSQRLRAKADVLISRGTAETGGMRGVFEAIKCAETFSYNYLQMMLLFISFVSSIVLVTLMSFISGMPIISYPAILLIVVALVFFTVAAFSTFKPRSFIAKKPIDMNEFTRMAGVRLISPIAATMAYFVLALYLEATGYIMDVGGLPLATTLGIMIAFLISFFGSMRTCLGKRIELSDIKGLAKNEKTRGNKILNVTAMTLVLFSVARMMLTAILIPAFAAEYGYIDISIETFYLLGLYIAVYFVFELVTDIVKFFMRKKST